MPPAEAPKRMTLPDGFHATLFAGEPDIVQPIAMTFDDRGRLWVVECLSYPKWTKEAVGNDRIVMFEDTDGDGKFDKRQVIWDKGANLSGIELGFGGIWLCSLPNFLFVPCDFNADTPKIGKPEVLLDGWSLNCKHNVFNSLTWGPDGWLYGCNGILDTSFVGKPGTPAKDRIPMNCGVWRYHPTRKIFDLFAHGTTNPFGLDFDDNGEMFITNCVIAHLWHVIQGAHFERMYGQDLNPHVYQLMQGCADHIHWGGGDWTSSRGGKGIHSEAGGGHAHVGCMAYLGDNWPAKYRNGLFMLNLHGNRVNHDRLERTASGYVAKHEPDFMLANDPWFRGIVIKYGPDGGVFVTDWTDTGECHNYDKVDLTNGRIFKITHGKAKLWQGDLSKLSDLELAKLQAHKNDWQVRHARRLLQERWHSRAIDKEALADLETKLAGDERRLKLRALWALFPDMTRRKLASIVEKSHDEWMQTWAIRLLAGQGDVYSPSIAPLLAKTAAAKDSTLLVRMAVASVLQHMGSIRIDDLKPIPHVFLGDSEKGTIPVDDRVLIARALLANPDNAADPALSLMIWYAVEPLARGNADQVGSLIAMTKIPLVQQFLTRRFLSGGSIEKKLAPVLSVLVTNTDAQLPILKGIQDAVAGRRRLATPSGWAEAYAKLAVNPSQDVRNRAMKLAVIFGDRQAIASLSTLIRDRSVATASRSDALEALLIQKDPQSITLVRELLDDPAMRSSAIRALASFENDDVPKQLLAIYPKLGDAEKADAVQTLAARSTWALALLDAIDNKRIPRSDVSVFVARQMQGLKDKRVGERLTKVWGQIQPASKEKAELMIRYKKLLTPESLKHADLSRGRLVFSKNCASCHRLYDDGGDIGPALTGSQRANLDYVLENVLDPSAIVAKEYQMNKIDTLSGRTINGIVKHETNKAITIQTPNEVIILPKDEIESRKPSSLSMMPEGLLDKLSQEEIRDLVAYLASKNQAPLPKER